MNSHLVTTIKKLWAELGEDRYVTVWLLQDRLSEPRQYQVNLRKLKKALVGGLVATVVIPLAFFIVGGLCFWGLESRENSSTLQSSTEIQGTNPVKGEILDLEPGELAKLERRVTELEGRMRGTCMRSEKLIRRIQQDLDHWWPRERKGGIGDGGEGSDGTPVSGKEGEKGPEPAPPLVAQITSLKSRLNQLESTLDGYQRSLDELESVWGDRNLIFASFPTYWPVEEGQISSPFGMRIHPLTGQLKLHTGVDIAAPRGTPIYAAASGLVIFAGRKGGYGNAIIINHGYHIETLYGHCSRLLVQPGQKVERGQKIALVGSTGIATGPHLHFEIRFKGIPVDPMNYLIGVPASAVK